MRITGSYERKGECDVCQKKVTRSKSFSGADMDEVTVQAEAWFQTKLRHPKCERV